MAKPTIVKTTSQPAEQQKRLPIVDNPSAPDLYADEAIGYLLTNNTVRITLASIKADHARSPNTNHMVVTNRLVMPVTAAVNLHKLLGRMIDNMKKASPQANADTGTHTVQ
jgi:hypothetical protein